MCGLYKYLELVWKLFSETLKVSLHAQNNWFVYYKKLHVFYQVTNSNFMVYTSFWKTAFLNSELEFEELEKKPVLQKYKEIFFKYLLIDVNGKTI